MRSETGARNELNLALAWRRFDEAPAGRREGFVRLARMAQDVLERHCPAVSWDAEAGARIAEALTGTDEIRRFAALESLTGVLAQLDSAWTLSGGAHPEHIRDLLWLGADRPAILRLQAVLPAADRPQRLIEDGRLRADLAEFERLCLSFPRPVYLRGFGELRESLGRVAYGRLGELRKDASYSGVLSTLADDTFRVKNFWSALPAVRKLVNLAARGSGGCAPEDARALETALRHHGLWPARSTADAEGA